MNERIGFIRSIIDAPDDDLPRLAFADWLQEHGEEERAEFVRVQVDIARFPGDPYAVSIPALEHCEVEPCDESDPRQVEAAKFCKSEMNRLGKLRKREDELYAEWAGCYWFSHALHLFYPEGDSNPYGGGPKPGVVLNTDHSYLRAQLRIRRGFIDGLVCRSDDFFHAVNELYWCRKRGCGYCRGLGWVIVRGRGHKKVHEDVQMGCKKCGGGESTQGTGFLPKQECPETAQPIRQVTLTDMPQLIFTGDGCFTWEGYPCRVPLPDQQHHAMDNTGLERCLAATFPGITFKVTT